MTKDDLIELAVGYGLTHGCGELVRGWWAITLFKRKGIELEGPDKWHVNRRYRLSYSEIQTIPDMPWCIGPFKHGWFSLKANRFVK